MLYPFTETFNTFIYLSTGSPYPIAEVRLSKIAGNSLGNTNFDSIH